MGCRRRIGGAGRETTAVDSTEKELKRLKTQDMQDQIEEQLKLLIESDSSEANLISHNTKIHCRLYKDSNNQLLLRLIKSGDPEVPKRVMIEHFQ